MTGTTTRKYKPLAGNRLNHAEGLLLTHLAHDGRAGHVRQETGAFATGNGQHLASRAEQRGFLHPDLFTQAIKLGQMFADRIVRQRQRHHFTLLHQILKQVFQCALAQAQAAFKGIIHAHVEPGFDTLVEELHRHAIHQRARQKRHEREHPQQAKGQLGAEYALLELFPQHPQLVTHQTHQRQRNTEVEHQQQGVILGKSGGVATGAGEKKQQYRT